MDVDERVTANITMIGEDRKGVIARVTQTLFQREANIEALEEHVARGRFHMALLASWDRDRIQELGREAIRGALYELGDQLEMETRVDFHRDEGEHRMAVFVTKEPHGLEAIVDAWEAGEVDAEPVVVVGNHDNELRDLAEDAGLPFVHIPWEDSSTAEARALEVLDEHEVDLIVLARFMQILSPGFCYRFRNRILNIHPSLLPAFPGAAPYRQAYEHGVRVVGVTAHFVTPDLDQGPIIAQDGFQVDWSDGLEEIKAKGRELEGEVLVEAIETYLEEDLDLHWGRVWSA